MLEPGGAGPRGAAGRAPGLVYAIEYREHAGHRALHAERDAGHALGPQLAQGGLVDAFRVGLGRDLGSGGQAELGVDGPQDATERRRGHQGRRPAAEEHRAHREVSAVSRRSEHLAGEPDLGDRQAGVAAHGYRGGAGRPAEFGGGVGVEVAVAAAGRAERHVHVDPERPLAQPAGARSPAGSRRRGRAHRRAGHQACSHATCPGAARPCAAGSRGPSRQEHLPNWGFARLDWKSRGHGTQSGRVHGRRR